MKYCDCVFEIRNKYFYESAEVANAEDNTNERAQLSM